MSELKGKNILFTGTLDLKRNDAKSMAEKAGASVKSAWSGQINIVIAGAAAGSKLDAAKASGVPIWDEAKFVAACSGKAAGGKPPPKAAPKPSRKTAREEDDDDDDDEPKAKKARGVAPAAAGGLAEIKGKTLVFTGALKMNRAEAKTKAESAGAKVTGDVSKNTNFVVVGDNAGSKLEKAKKFGCTIWTEAEFVARFGEGTTSKKKKAGSDDEDDDDDGDEDDDEGFWENDEPACKDVVTGDLVARVEADLGYKLPAAYVALCATMNGGQPRKTYIKGFSSVGITDIYGIGFSSGGVADPNNGSKQWTDEDEWGYPKIGVYFAETESGGHDLFCLDYSKCGPKGEPQVSHVEQEADPMVITPVAPSFSDFLKRLTDEEQDC